MINLEQVTPNHLHEAAADALSQLCVFDGIHYYKIGFFYFFQEFFLVNLLSSELKMKSFVLFILWILPAKKCGTM